MQNAYNKYGSEVFEYKIREVFSSIEDLENAEKRILIEEKHRLYNIKEGGYKAKPVKMTEEGKRRISERQKIPVIGMSVKTGEIKEYACVKDTKTDGFNYKNIGKCCLLSISYASGRVQQAISAGKWVWMYKSEFNLQEMERRRKMAKLRGKNDQSRAIIGKSLIDASTISFRSCSEAGRALKTQIMTIRGACLWKEVKSAAQHVWVFVDEIEPTILLEKRYLYAVDTFNGHRVIGPRSKRSFIKKA